MGSEGLVQKTAEAITPGSEPDLNPWKGTPMAENAEYNEDGSPMSKNDFERIGERAAVRNIVL
jgi:hypothetical protein